MATYRPVLEDEMEAFDAMTGYAFGPERGPHDPDAIDERLRRRWAFGERRGMYDGDELVACCSHLEFTARVRSTWLPIAGLSAVATAPQYRRQGHVGDLLIASLEEYRERNWPLVALQPFKESFYARYGWATGARYYRARIDVEALEGVVRSPDGTFHSVTPEEGAALEPVYETWLDGVTLATKRTPDWWRNRVFQGHESEHFGTRWNRDGDPRGYVIYRIRDDDGERSLSVVELGYVDIQALRQLLRFCFNHDSQVDRIELIGPQLDVLIDLVGDRMALELTEEPGQMVRIVDVPRALEAVSYPAVAGDDCVIEVTDSHAPWNDGRFRLSFEGGTVTVERTDDTPDVRTTIGCLTQLYVGYRPARYLANIGGIEPTDSGQLDLIDTAFPPTTTYLPESF